MFNAIKSLFTLNDTEKAFQAELEQSKKNGTLPRISGNGTLHVSISNVRRSDTYKKIKEHATI